MPRFVVLRHEPNSQGGKPLHWDFMIESGGVLKTWALDDEPRPGQLIESMQLPDHRAEYLTYEGEVSGNRGVVQRWDNGTFEWVREAKDAVEIRVAGQRLRGDVAIRQSISNPQRWTFTLSPSDLMTER